MFRLTAWPWTTGHGGRSSSGSRTWPRPCCVRSSGGGTARTPAPPISTGRTGRAGWTATGGPSTSARGPRLGQPGRRWRSPVFPAGGLRACQVLRRRGVTGRLAIATPVRSLLQDGEHRHPGVGLRRSMAGLRVPLSTLHARPRGPPRMTRGQCGSLRLHCRGLPPPTSWPVSRRTRPPHQGGIRSNFSWP